MQSPVMDPPSKFGARQPDPARFHRFRASPRDMKAPAENSLVVTTLVVTDETKRLKSLLQSAFSSFQGGAWRQVKLLRNRQDCQYFSGFYQLSASLRNPVYFHRFNMNDLQMTNDK
jgi:hypothetical protein